MFGFFETPQSKLIGQAKHLVEYGKKVLAYRRDILDKTVVRSIEEQVHGLKVLTKTKYCTPEQLSSACTDLEAALKKHGGKIYPVKSLADNVEVFLVAAIVAIGIRTFFFQPFTIPTNSMYPSYYGMTPQVWMNPEDAPGRLHQMVRAITLGASRYTVNAPTSGRLEMPIGRSGMRYEVVKGRKWLILPDKQREYVFYVDGKPTEPIRVPFDFSLDSAVFERFGSGSEDVEEWLHEQILKGNVRMEGNQPMLLLSPYMKKDAVILDFDILTGDTLFVDRISYHFSRPKVGDPIVFRTRQIAGLAKPDGAPSEVYYTKRLVGLPGDKLKIEGSTLYRNGEPITGAPAFEEMSKRENSFCGYCAYGALKDGHTAVVEPGTAYGLGDNSANSLDSRFWGGIPLNEIVGKSAFIFYPCTNRWGPAK